MLEPRRLLISSAAFIVLLFCAVGALGYWFRDPLESLSRGFVDVMGGPGVALGYFVPDAFTIPFPNDTFGLFGLAGGLAFWEVVAWGTVGSVLGGGVGWFIGRALRRTRWVGTFMGTKGLRLEQMLLRNGAWVVIVAAITPLPYSLAAWAAGGVGMPLPYFLLVSLSRVLRVAGSLYLIQLGLLTTG